ncbi:thiamine pyrophosphate-dependent dehydrogenase E1 component subunit alpha [Alicyclobacillus sp. SO9]|uniref:thiamine pyrophosphate-dependent dehydrogenase E1 component subunit alpha n=1 Tax=Alicyclobacillus sp. SO9 TaxID=2665646 RepID=UPI0018E7330A|nr:thiamine pyrophosphate-dependent dehydrogenase E1 component subunit alpha [Alicyclobacillus sp. SO9]QQE76927.1 thiamine pyrophosphate-dependent dehydrogenase E1 component subunit alpha [Alicyclobacillus sp. SO9]
MTAEPKHIEAGLTDQQVMDMYRYMVLARFVDDRMWLLNRSGKIPFVVSCQGQEGAQAGAGFALNRGVDYIAPYYRDLCLVLIYGHTAKTELLSAFGKPEDPNSGGRQMPGHFGDKSLHMLSGSSPVGTQIPHAVGTALASKMRGEDTVSLVTFGEGTSNQGEFHEAANFAGVNKLPVIFLVENNQYAISIPADKQLACENVADRAIGYGFEGVIVDGNDAIATYIAVKAAVDKARQGGGPTLIEAKTYRLAPHSSDDDDRSYRTREEVEEWKQKDPILHMKQYMMDNGLLTEEQDSELRKELTNEVNEATRYAEEAPHADPSTLMLHVYAEEARHNAD